MLSHYCQLEVEVWVPHLATVATWGRGASFYCWVGMGVQRLQWHHRMKGRWFLAVRDGSPTSLLGLLWLRPGTCSVPVAALPGGESRLPVGLCWSGGGEATVFLTVCGFVECLMSKGFLSFSAVPFLVFCREIAGCFGSSFPSVPLAFLDC